MVRQFVSHRPKAAPGRPPRPAEPRSAPETAPEKGADEGPPAPAKAPQAAKEIGGPSGPEPTRYGDWERKGICVDF